MRQGRRLGKHNLIIWKITRLCTNILRKCVDMIILSYESLMPYYIFFIAYYVWNKQHSFMYENTCRRMRSWALNVLLSFFLDRKLIKSPGETVIRILEFLPKYISEAELAKQFVDILLLFLENKTQNSGERIVYIHTCSLFILCLFDNLISALILKLSWL